MKNLKRVLIATVSAGLLFMVGYGVAAKAWPTPYNVGYFTGTYDTWGVEVWPVDSDSPGCPASSGNAIPSSVNTASEFKAYVKCKLASPNNYWPYVNMERTGAAFIIQTMLGDTGSKITSVNDSRVALWESVVDYYSSQGWINWSASYGYGYNSYFQGSYGGGTNDDAFYGESGTATAIVFSDGSSSYGIRRQCANPIGSALAPLRKPWSATGTTTVTDGVPNAGDTSTLITTRPGDTLSFRNRITNNGPGSAGIWYALYGHNNTSGTWTGQYYNNTSLSGSPVVTRSDGQNVVDGTMINFDWGSGSPGAGINADNFSVRWTRTSTYSAGTYTFNTVTDDGVRLYVDGNLVFNDWANHPPTSNYTNVNLTAGTHTIVMEYFEGVGGATAILSMYNVVQGGQNGGSFSPGQTKDFYRSVPVPPNAPSGSRICTRVLWDWKNSSASGDYPYGSAGMSAPACAIVSANYTLVPTVTSSSLDGTVEEGESVTFTYYVRNTGSDNSPSVACNTGGSGPAPTPAPPATSCPTTFNTGVAAPGTQVASETFVITTQTPGGQICRTLTVNPSNSSGTPATSPQVCVTVAKTPYVHFTGGDVWAGGNFAAVNAACNSSAKIAGKAKPLPAGSTVEYGAFALGVITEFGSASQALTGGFGKKLTFSNTVGTLGNFASPSHCIPDYVSKYQSAPTLAGGSTVNLASPPVGTGIWHVTGDLNISGALPAGSRQVYLVDGNVNVTGNINYVNGNPTYSSVNDIPSLIVIAAGSVSGGTVTNGNVFVQAGVTGMDGVFVARNTFYTCYPKPVPILITSCTNQLKINGSVLAGKLDLYRTAGGGGTPTPAEIFNLIPEVYLRSALNASSSDVITTADSRELPPRF